MPAVAEGRRRAGHQSVPGRRARRLGGRPPARRIRQGGSGEAQGVAAGKPGSVCDRAGFHASYTGFVTVSKNGQNALGLRAGLQIVQVNLHK